MSYGRTYPVASSTECRRYGIFNPVPLALAHYEMEFIHCLGLAGGELVNTTPAPGVEVGARLAMKARRALELMLARHAAAAADHDTMVLWPAFGLFEPAMWRTARRRRGGRSIVILHDPLPLRKQYGLGRTGAVVGRFAGPRVSVLVHTEAARKVVDRLGWSPALVAPHPIAPMTSVTAPTSSPPARTRGEVLVCGQWKPARDIKLLAALGPLLRRRGFEPVIAGRGWRPLDGWNVVEGFMSEEALTERLRSARCLLIPYIHYFQSNVAVRAVENAVPVVGYRHPFLDQLFGPNYNGYVEGVGDPLLWADAVELALSNTAASMMQIHSRYEAAAVAGWREVLWGSE